MYTRLHDTWSTRLLSVSFHGVWRPGDGGQRDAMRREFGRDDVGGCCGGAGEAICWSCWKRTTAAALAQGAELAQRLLTEPQEDAAAEPRTTAHTKWCMEAPAVQTAAAESISAVDVCCV